MVPVLVFLPSTNEHQRFVLTGAFSKLPYDVQYVVSSVNLTRMRDASPGLFTPKNTHILDIPPERFAQWNEIFNLSCVVHAGRSRSFALRVNGRCDQGQLDEAVHAMRPYPKVDALLDKVNPLYCFLPTSLLDDYCNDVLLSAHNVVLLQSGWDNLSSKGMIHHHPQYAGVWGPQSARHARNIQGIASPFVLGAPHYGPLVPVKKPSEKLILFGGSFRRVDETSILRRLDRWLGKSGYRAIYRPHPWRADRVNEQSFFDCEWKHIDFDETMKARYVKSKQQANTLHHAPQFDMNHLASLLARVDCVISPMSTLLLEALIMDKPAMALAFGEAKANSEMTHFNEIKPAVDWCADEDKFEDHCDRLVSRTNNPTTRALALANIVHLSDRPYSERLVNFLDTRPLIDEPMSCGHLPNFGYKHTEWQDGVEFD